MLTRTRRDCEWCHRGFMAALTYLEQGKARFCSKSCGASARWFKRAKNGGRKCARPSCSAVGVYREGQSLYCLRCRRIRQMVSSARARYPKLKITREYLERLLTSLNGMRCPRCGVSMTWGCNGNTAPKAKIITLQHHGWRTSFLCHRCNVTLGVIGRWRKIRERA